MFLIIVWRWAGGCVGAGTDRITFVGFKGVLWWFIAALNRGKGIIG